MAQATIQLRIQKKLLKVMGLFAKQTEITNDEVEKLLHVSDATATRYLAVKGTPFIPRRRRYPSVRLTLNPPGAPRVRSRFAQR